MEYARLIINYNGEWDKSVYGFYSYKGGSSKGMRVPKNMTYAELLDRVVSIINVDLSKFDIKLKSVFQTSYRSPLVEINDDSDVEFLLCEDRVIPQVGISLIKKIDHSSRGSADLQEEVQLPVPQAGDEATDVPFASQTDLLSLLVPATTLPSHSQCTPVQSADEIGEECPTYYSDDMVMNQSENGSPDKDDAASNHESGPYMENAGGLVEPGLGPDSVNLGYDTSATINPTQSQKPRTAAFTLEDLRSGSSHNCFYRLQLFRNKKELRRALEEHALKENFDIRVRRSSTKRFEVICSELECEWRLIALKYGEGSEFQVRRYDSNHTCALDKIERRRWQGKPRKASKRPRKQTTAASGELEARQNQCGKCGGLGHNRIKCKNLVLPENNTPEPPAKPVERLRKCRTCGATGHNRQNCPNWEPPVGDEN